MPKPPVTMPTIFQQAKLHVVDFLLPPRCGACGVTVDAQGALCPTCWADIHFLSPAHACDQCGIPFPHAVPEGTKCAKCLTTPPPFRQLRAAVRYDDTGKKLITRLKYGDGTHLVPLISEWMIKAGSDLLQYPSAILAPVPLHWRRRLARRFNQSSLLARAIAQETGHNYLVDGLQRKRHTAPQASLKGGIRHRNVHGAFRISPSHESRLKGAHVILVDDVVTTGATVRECARILQKAGVPRISVLCFARTGS